jgi:hypothetical protein
MEGTGHADHFLSRLDRVSHSEVQLALSLYNDVPLLKAVLAELKVPDSVPRVAISLDDPREGPFVVITRDAKFVTCLGRGMVPTNLHVVPRADLDRAATKMQDLKARIWRAHALTRPGEAFDAVMQRLYDAGPELTREEIVALLGMQPLLHGHFLESFVLVSSKIIKSERAILSLGKIKPAHHALLRTHWNAHWAIAHLLVLATHRAQRAIDELPPSFAGLKEQWCRRPMRANTLGACVRSAWAAAAAGRAILPFYKARWAATETYEGLLESNTVLAAIGLRSARSRTEVMKALGIGKPSVLESEQHSPMEKIRSVLSAFLLRAFEDPSGATAAAKTVARMMLRDFCLLRMGEGSIHRYESDDAVPDDLLLAMLAFHEAKIRASHEMHTLMTLALPWVVESAPEELYFPRAFLAEAHIPWAPERTFALIPDAGREPPTRVPVRVEERPSRNELCKCGSGAKYKRCCGR